MFLTLANKITLARIGLIVPVLILLQYPSRINCVIACALFAVASVTDWLDGYIARRDKQISSLGKFLDPLADKLLVGSVLIVLVGLGWTQSWIVIIIIMREIAVTGLRAIASDEGLVIAADKYGKLKTIIQLVAIGPMIFHYPLWGINIELIGNILLYIALALTVFSGINYFYAFFMHWHDKCAKSRPTVE
jgi:CDP-diacylglycerol--glycerol-3-phosphate 3-phosphatidyltransferase